MRGFEPPPFEFEVPSPTFLTHTSTPTSVSTPTPTRSSTPTATFTVIAEEETVWYPCPDLYPSRLSIGERAYVSFNPPLANNVREQPSLNAALLGKIQPGGEMEILDGPECSNHMVWWYIQASGISLRGWTSEGDIDDYWLVPIQ